MAAAKAKCRVCGGPLGHPASIRAGVCTGCADRLADGSIALAMFEALLNLYLNSSAFTHEQLDAKGAARAVIQRARGQ